LSLPTGTPALPAPTGDPKADAAAFARAFLKAVHDGTASPVMLTPEFKKVIAEPVFSDDQAKGYSDEAAGEWLLRFKNTLPEPATELQGMGDAYVLAGRAGHAHVALRVVRAGSGWLADWYDAARAAPDIPLPAGEAAFRAFACSSFLDALIGKDDRLAEGLISPLYKAELAPPFGSDKRGYNRGILTTRLAEFRDGFTTYVIVSVPAHGEITVGGGAGVGWSSTSAWVQLKVELVKGDKKRPFTLELVRNDRPWDWQVREFKPE
jgi:hypothetical protein